MNNEGQTETSSASKSMDHVDEDGLNIFQRMFLPKSGPRMQLRKLKYSRVDILAAAVLTTDEKDAISGQGRRQHDEESGSSSASGSLSVADGDAAAAAGEKKKDREGHVAEQDHERDPRKVDVSGTGLERTLGWKGAAFNAAAYSIALGVLSIPSAATIMGEGAFVILSVFFSFITWYTATTYARLQKHYPGVHSLTDAGDLIFGPVGREFFGFCQALFSILLCGNHVLLGATAFQALGWRSCAIALNVVFAIISFIFTLPRSYQLFARLAFVSMFCIVSTVVIVMIASGVSGPQNQTTYSDPVRPFKGFGSISSDHVDFLDGMLAVTNLFVSFGSSPCYLPLLAEMRSPQDFKKSMIALISFQFVLYLVVGTVVYHNLGQYVTSPSIGSLSPVMQKVSYGVALPTILLAGCESGQVVSKQLYVRILRARSSQRQPTEPTKTSRHKARASSWIIWISINAFVWTAAYILAELIPFFSSFLGVESAALWTLFVAFASIFHLFLSRGKLFRGWWNSVQTAAALFIIAFSAFVMVSGVWAAAISIRDSYTAQIVGSPFSCELPKA